MKSQLVSVIAEIAACQAEVAAMQAENLNRDSNGLAQAYGESDFFDKAEYLHRLSLEARAIEE